MKPPLFQTKETTLSFLYGKEMGEVKGKVGISVKGHVAQDRAVEMERREAMGQKFIFNLQKE